MTGAVAPSPVAPAGPKQDGDPRELGAGECLELILERVVGIGGTERVAEAILADLPEAAVGAPDFGDRACPDLLPELAARVQPLWKANRFHHYLAPVYARRMGRVEAKRDLVLSLSSHGWALAVAARPGARQISYFAGPTPSLHGRVDGYVRAHPAAARPLLRAGGPAARAYNRRLVSQPHRLITNSTWSASGIERVYGRRADVVHPPVRTEFFTPGPGTRSGFLFVSRLVPQKRPEVVVDAFRGFDQELLVVGGGPLLERLRREAPPNVRFAGQIPEPELRAAYRGSEAVICPSVEEFGIVMAEAQACGLPVIAPRAGGALDIVSDPRTGRLLDPFDSDSLAGAVAAFDPRDFDPQTSRRSAERFSEQRFVTGIRAVLAEELARVSA